MATSLLHHSTGVDSFRYAGPSLLRTRSLDESKSLPRLDFSRPSSTASTYTSQFHTPPPPHNRTSSVQLPGLATLASIAAGNAHIHNGHPYSGGPNMSYATVAPGQQAAGFGSAPPICQNCETSTTPLWRRDESGSVLCNACGLFLKLHGKPRPISLKTDVIKSRNRVRTPAQGGKKRTYQGQGLAAAHPEVATGRRQSATDNNANTSSATNVPDGTSLSRSSTPSHYQQATQGQHPGNIAPQHLFDSAAVDVFSKNPGLQYNNGTHSPTEAPTAMMNGGGDASVASGVVTQAQTYEALLATNNALKTRVSELEVINELFRGRVEELENSEAEARRKAEESARREAELRRRLEEFEGVDDGREDDGAGSRRRSKRVKLSDFVEDDVPES